MAQQRRNDDIEKRLTRRLVAGLTLSVPLATVAQQTPPAAPTTGAQQAGRGGGRGAVDSRVQQRTYTFADTNEQMPYALFVSSKVTKDKKNPLIVSLHGLGGDQNTMVRESLRSVELAEQGGYILVAPMGYNSGRLVRHPSRCAARRRSERGWSRAARTWRRHRAAPSAGPHAP